jgi:hypothetical protein
MSDLLQIALNYIGRGWNPVPLPFRAKKPAGNGWQSRVIDAATAPHFFNGGPQNIGVILGPSSHGLTDVDLDVSEAIAIAPYLLPPTEAVFGRISKRASHRLYVTDLSATADTAAIRLRAPNRATLLELRIGGNKGAQTVFPGSVHETGEPIAWESNGEPTVADGGDLHARVKRVAAACLIARNWPVAGSRHDAALALGGFLSRAGLTENEIKLIVEAATRAAGDPEWRDRVQAAKDATRAHIAGKPAGGFSKLTEFIDETAVRKISEWLGNQIAGIPAFFDFNTAQTQGAAATIGSPWPQIRIIPGEVPRVVNEAESALLLLGREIYQRGGLVVRPQLVPIKTSGDREFEGWRLMPITWPYMMELFSCAARWLKYDGRRKGWLQVDVPRLIIDAYLARGKWKLPHIVGIANAPFLHADGSIHDREGYDPVSGLLCKWDGQTFPPVPLTPTKADALAALAELEKPLAEFPFVTRADKAAALSAILTALDRRGMDVAPLHAFTAPAAGTGKGLLVNVIAILATGRPMPTIDQPPSRHSDELKKCLGASLIAGDSLIALDNCQHILEGSFLNTIVKEHVFRVRILGQSQNVDTPNNVTLFANGNNLTIGADMTRRVILCEMDARMERPELREFNDDHLLDTVRVNRTSLITAALTVLRAWHLARPAEQLKLKPLDFNDWSRRVREALVWLGHDDPGGTMERIRENDPYRADRAAVFMEWHKALGENVTLVRDVIAAAFGHPDLYAALKAVAASRNGKEISPDRLGRWLARNKGSIVNNLTLVRTGSVSGGFPLWQIQRR